MNDIAIVLKENGIFDLSIVNQDIATEKGLKTAVIISLFTDARCEPEELPPGETDRRGSWIDALSEDPKDRMGSKLWLLARETVREEVLEKAKRWAEESLEWLKDEQIVSEVEVETEFQGEDRIAIGVAILKPDGNTVNYRFPYAWQNEVAG